MRYEPGTAPPSAAEPDPAGLERERYELLERIDGALETPMLVLAFVWLALLVVELTHGTNAAFDVLGTVIWAIFIIHFALQLLLAPRRLAYLKSNWLTAISLLVPAVRLVRVFRVFRVLQLSRVGRGVRLFRFVSSMNRGMRALGASLRRRGFGYIVALTMLVILAGAAGMLAFEGRGGGGIRTYGDAVWWTAMIITTMGSDYWPTTFEGRVLCVFLSLYAFGVFGYVTATLATFFVGRDAEDPEAEAAGSAELAALRSEIAALRTDLRASIAGR